MTYSSFIDIIVAEVYNDYKSVTGAPYTKYDIMNHIDYLTQSGESWTGMVRFAGRVYIFTYEPSVEDNNLKIEIYRRIKWKKQTIKQSKQLKNL